MEYMEDAQGRQVPIDLVSEIDKLRDQTVKEIASRALKMRDVLQQFKQHIRDDIFTFISLSAEKYGKIYGGKKGNITLMSYDGKYKLVIAMNDEIVFDERLQIARELIAACINKWSTGSRDEIKVLVNDAFQVDKSGKINTARVLGLRRLQINDPDWEEAMRAITDSIQVTGSKQYLRIYERNSQGKYTQVPLDVAAL
ncbi:DUF3164 family protein [Sediminispirochaeta bajacaliforniensis]|uniref:DUF3164 family protein n=1 Tax=Sediminispirochaeta bajacaliforniensis TaxID=148 RepID=UPI0003609CCB|nr:DUF3164 family protein [Sediminispirochaeta bajacaliforniensis]